MSLIADQIGGFGVFIGSNAAAGDREFLRKNNIRAVLDVGGDNKIFYKNIRYSSIVVDDDPAAPIDAFFNIAYDFIELGRVDGNVLVCCEDGRSRSVTIVTAWLMKKFRMPLTYAVTFVKRDHSTALPNSGFVDKLCKLIL